MPGPIDMTPPNSGVKQRDEARWSSDEFRELTKHHLMLIAEVEHSLHIVCTPFKERGNILPMQCKVAIKTLNETNRNMRQFCELLNETSRLPIVFTALRYRLLLVLHLTEEKVCKLINLLERFRVTCMKPSLLQERREIYDAFQTLLQHISDISQQAQFLDEEAQFQERILIAALEEKGFSELNRNTNQSSHGRPLYMLNSKEVAAESPQEATTSPREEKVRRKLIYLHSK